MMNQLFVALRHDLLDPNTPIGVTFYGLMFLGIAIVLRIFVRRAVKHIEAHLSDATGLRFASALAQVLIFLVGFILYAHVVPGLRTLGTALLAGASVVSLVLGFAAQNTLGNLIAGLSLVLYRPVRIGDTLQLTTPKGLATATVEMVSLGYTILRETDDHEIIVPNSVMMTSVVIRVGGQKAY